MAFGFGGLKKALGGAARELKADYGKNKDFLEAACAVVALVAYADGTLEEEEHKKAVQIIGNHPQLSKLYPSKDINDTLESMFSRASSYSGRIQLKRELDDIKGKGDTMAEDCYLIGLDIAHADGELEGAEAKALTEIADRLGVNLKKLGLEG